MLEELKEILMEQFDILEDEIDLESNIAEDFKADSLDIVELASIVEEKYDIRFEKEDLKKIVKVKDIIKLIKEKKENWWKQKM